jgi:hypothetical protein
MSDVIAVVFYFQILIIISAVQIKFIVKKT